MEILESKLTGKNKLAFGRPLTKGALLSIFYNFVSTLKRNGTCFFGSTDKAVPLGLALRTPSYLSTILCVDSLLEHAHIELTTEQCGRRVLIKGRPSCFELCDSLAVLVDQAQVTSD